MPYKTRGLSIFSVAAIGLVCCITSTAQAVTLPALSSTTGFSGDYAVSNWVEGGSKTLGFYVPGLPQFFQSWLEGAPGSVDLSGAPASISITTHTNGMDAPDQPDVVSFFTFTAPAATDGKVSFDWDFDFLRETDLVRRESFGFILNDITHNLAGTSMGGADLSGSEIFSINKGDIFGFYSQTPDSLFGPASATISNFSVAPIPVPPALGLFLSAIGLLGWVRNGRHK
jgi:hypothetical protein